MLQRSSTSAAFASFMVLVFSCLLFSFSGKMGGDKFEIYLNKKLAIQQYVTMNDPVKSLQLDQNNLNDQVEVYYSHCGKTGTGRSISIRDAQHRILKEWHFQDTPDAKTSMACNVKDIIGLQKLRNTTNLSLYYTAHELPAGRLLAILTTDDTLKTAP
ncbi:MAG: hypothetical protein ABIQ88_17275 [Chitinophagaceae bacterium]